MSLPTFNDFRRQALAEGFDEVVERRWPADTVVDAHTHPFALKAIVVAGEMWLTVAGSTRHLSVGDTFSLDRDAVHDEHYGKDGAIYWVARRN